MSKVWSQDKANLLQDLFHASRIVDLSVLLEQGIPRWPTHPPLLIGQAASHEHDGYANQLLTITEHTGTHVDAPYHIHADLAELTIDRVDPAAVMGRCVVIDLAYKEWQAGERASLADLRAALDAAGAEIREGDIVLIHYGWMNYWKTSREWIDYASGQPGLTEDAADFFVEKKVKAVGTDTAAVGTPVKSGVADSCYFHAKVLRESIYLIECLNRLDELPPVCFFIGLPLRIAGGSGSPIRAVAIV